MLGTVVATSGIIALLSDAVFTAIAYLIGKNSGRPRVKVNMKKYRCWYWFIN